MNNNVSVSTAINTIKAELKHKRKYPDYSVGIALDKLNIHKLPDVSGLEHYTGSIDVTDTHIGDLTSFPMEELAELHFGLYERFPEPMAYTFSLHGKVKRCKHLHIYAYNCTINLAGMPKVDELTVFGMVTASNINFEGLDIDALPISAIRDSRSPFYGAYLKYHEREMYRRQALHNSTDEAGLSNILNLV